MPVFFFHVRQNDLLTVDTAGQAFRTFGAAVRAVEKSVIELTSDSQHCPDKTTDVFIEVSDSIGNTLITIPVGITADGTP